MYEILYPLIFRLKMKRAKQLRLNYILCGMNIGLTIFNIINLIVTKDLIILLVLILNILAAISMIFTIKNLEKE